jgi:hypothetical protein
VTHIQLGFITRDTVKAMISLSTGPHFVLVDTVGDTKQGQCKAEQHQPEEYRVAFVVFRLSGGKIGPSITMSVFSSS